MTATVRKLKVAGLLFGLAVAFVAGAAAQHPTPTNSGPQVTPAEGLARYERMLEAEADPLLKFYLTTKLATTALEAGDREKAKTYAHALLEQAPAFRNDWNYGNAIHLSNIVLGRLALASGDVAGAGRFLVEAGKTPGSPQLNGFGPNMMLAKELLEKGRREEVVEYLDLAAKFWKVPMGRLEQWKAAVAKGETPDFGPSLGVYLNAWRNEKWPNEKWGK
jgi:hypothetical protein